MLIYRDGEALRSQWVHIGGGRPAYTGTLSWRDGHWFEDYSGSLTSSGIYEWHQTPAGLVSDARQGWRLWRP